MVDLGGPAAGGIDDSEVDSGGCLSFEPRVSLTLLSSTENRWSREGPWLWFVSLPLHLESPGEFFKKY